MDHLSTNLERNYGGRRWEIDILAVNSAELVAVEVKTTLKVRDVDHFLETLRNVTVLLPEYGAHAAYGAVAYLKANESADAYAQRQGLFVIRATGSSASITNREDFRPRTSGNRWHAVRGKPAGSTAAVLTKWASRPTAPVLFRGCGPRPPRRARGGSRERRLPGGARTGRRARRG